jgi:hypothetical protein
MMIHGFMIHSHAWGKGAASSIIYIVATLQLLSLPPLQLLPPLPSLPTSLEPNFFQQGILMMAQVLPDVAPPLQGRRRLERDIDEKSATTPNKMKTATPSNSNDGHDHQLMNEWILPHLIDLNISGAPTPISRHLNIPALNIVLMASYHTLQSQYNDYIQKK